MKSGALEPMHLRFIPRPCLLAGVALWLAGASSLRAAETPRMQAIQDPVSGQVEVREGRRPVLRYNYRTVEPGDALLRQVAEGNRIYARARSDYIHPLFGLHGEELTRDWSIDHPHHRGIYWAWPEVEVGAERGDLHALQRIFARPTGELRLVDGDGMAEIVAVNRWLWEDRDPVVEETTRIRAHRSGAEGRIVDLEFRFTGLRKGVTIARRDTRLYGGLNVRLATPQDQRITVHTDPTRTSPRRAWSDLSGRFQPDHVSGLTILQHPDNPEYPGEWIQYPELSWCQPTFPTAGTRYPLRPGKTLILRYRLWIHDGPTPSDDTAARIWDAFALDASAPDRRTQPNPALNTPQGTSAP